jgi:hypothetical protein
VGPVRPHLHRLLCDLLRSEAVDVDERRRGGLRVDAAAPDPDHSVHRLKDVASAWGEVELLFSTAKKGQLAGAAHSA